MQKRGKKAAKLFMLTVVLGLCMAMTACYIAPDDDVNQGTQASPNARPFATLPPQTTEAITPDTININDQNVFPVTTPAGGQSGGQATANAGGNGWDGWGTVQQGTDATPTPYNGGGVVFGDTSPSPGSVINTFGVVTPTPTPEHPVTPTPTVSPTPTPPSLQIGFTGSDAVRALQRRLKELGYYKGAADGDFGVNTEKAVKEFQKANGLSADGKAGEKTLAKLNSKNAVTYKQAHATPTPRPTQKATAKPTKKPTATPNLTRKYYLQEGSRGSQVETLQRRLIELGWLDGKVTGSYDASTKRAVEAFQEKTQGLWTDGIAGPDTLRAIYSSGAARTTRAVSSSETLELGSEGAEVRKLQQKLKDLGYLSGSVDGSFGVATQAAVIAFQRNNNLTADGKAGTATQSKLYSGTALKSSSAAKIDAGSKQSSGRDTKDIASTGYTTLENGVKGEAVRRLQQRLKNLGYYTGSVDGSFGDGTEAAVMAFQLQNNLTVDGKAGPATQRVLYGSNSVITYSALRMGDTGNAVRNLQYTLYELGYYDGAIDGDYGQTTSDAVRAFQIQNKVEPVDGVAGSITLGKLYSSTAISAAEVKPDYGTYRAGDTGDVVVDIQDCLVQMGYLDAVTGVYDDATVEAVKAFQKANNLTPDGSAGTQTLMVLFGY